MSNSNKNPYKDFPLHESLKDSYVDRRIMNGEKRSCSYPDNGVPKIKDNLPRAELPSLAELDRPLKKEKRR